MRSLFTAESNIHLEIANNGEPGVETARLALGHLLPLLRGIGTITCVGPYIRCLPSILEQFSTEHTAPKLLEHYMCADNGHFVPQILRWLCTRRADHQPRMALLFSGLPETPSTVWRPFYDGILVHFLAATTPVSFFVFFGITYTALYPSIGELDAVLELSAENRVTGEQLVVRSRGNVSRKGDVLLIGRCPAKLDADT